MPSTAGLKEAKIQAKWFEKKWKEFDFDSVEITDYNVLLSLPKKPGKITMYDEEGDLVKGYEIDREPLLNGDPKDPRTVLPFNAYSPGGTVEVIYLCIFLKNKLLAGTSLSVLII